ncbi:MAG: Hsp33 family molecular chaperone HslO [Clostridia bacterium]|nr:Hsp33 family molecular chaperone HslO [Clostridia bacterium]MBQ7914444.1 Hsp33 family molecular chaperone HslO [Clostridia bacterium]MBR7176692.1 Hsp33 family molecular chaperone HslO [Clostridia bacterium]
MKKSTMVKAIINNAITVTAIESSALVQKAIKLHKLSPVAAIALGRALTMAALMSDDFKHTSDKLSATIKGGGPLGDITVAANGKGQVKGMVEHAVVQGTTNPDGTLNVGAAVGKNGTLTVIRDLGLKQNYGGTTRLISGEIAQDFAYYYAESEQQPCGITLGVGLDNKSCKSAGGVFVQVMPNCPPDLLWRVETIMYAMDEMSYQFDGSTAKEVISRFFGEFDLVFVDEKQITYKCGCSKRRMDNIIKSLGQEECQAILAEQGTIDIHCHFCNKTYTYTSEDVQSLFTVS